MFLPSETEKNEPEKEVVSVKKQIKNYVINNVINNVILSNQTNISYLYSDIYNRYGTGKPDRGIC